MTNPLMHYIDSAPKPAQQPQPGAAPASGARKFQGEVAKAYDAKRATSEKWVCEQRVIEAMLADLAAGSVVLDCPVGTGRFLEFYRAKGFHFIGADLSPDMLVQSALKVMPKEAVERWVAACNARNDIQPLPVGPKSALVVGDIREIGLPDKSVDAAVACRITRWLSPEDNQKMLRELQRVTRQRIIITARVANHPHARSVELFEQALDGWAIYRNEAGYTLDYRIIAFRPVVA